MPDILSKPTEADRLLAELRNPDRRDEGFRRLTQRYGRCLYWHIRRIVVSHDDAEDVLQETFVKIYTSIAAFKGDAQLTTWMYRIATNEALQWLRRRTRLFQSLDDVGESLLATLQTETTPDAEKSEILFQQALLQLPTQQRVAFNMRYYDELSYEEIAQITGKQVGTLKTNYHYAVEKIKNYIKAHT